MIEFLAEYGGIIICAGVVIGLHWGMLSRVYNLEATNAMHKSEIYELQCKQHCHNPVWCTDDETGMVLTRDFEDVISKSSKGVYNNSLKIDLLMDHLGVTAEYPEQQNKLTLYEV